MITAATADGLKTRPRFVRLSPGRAERLAEERAKPCSEEVEDHGEIGRHHRDKSFPDSPFGREFGARDRFLRNGINRGTMERPILLETYHQNSDSLEGRADEDQQTGAKHDSRGYLLVHLQRGPP